MTAIMRLLPTLLGLWLAGLCLLPAAWADDTEIFFGQSDEAFQNNPNILFVLDSSGSMNEKDGGTVSRMDRLKQAMNLLLDQSSSYNVGLMAFQGWNWGGAVRYPVGYLESDSGELCPNGICPDEVVVARPAQGNDDATQHDTTNAVTLDAPYLAMATVVDTATTTTTGSTTEVSGSAPATAYASEAVHGTSGTVSQRTTETVNEWFYYGNAAYGRDRYAYRFDNVDIPAGATVTAATITFTQTAISDQSGSVSAYISAEATPDPDPLPDGSNGYDSLALRNDTLHTTNELIAWGAIEPADPANPDSSMPAADAKVDTPELAALVNELVNLPGWAAGKAMSFLIDPFDDYTPSNSDLRSVYSPNAASDRVPVLNYTYTLDADTTSNTLTLNASAHVDEITEQNTATLSRNASNGYSRLFYAGDLNEPRKLALTFDNVDIPQGAVINTARLVMTSAAATATDAPDTDWVVDASTVPATPPSTTTTTSTTTASATATVTANIQIELTGAPAGYDTDRLSDRSYTSSFVPWADIPLNESTAMTSPDLSALVSEVTGLAGWNPGDSLSLLISAPSDYENTLENSRLLATSTASASERPQLIINWEDSGGGGSTVVETQTTAIRFQRVHVPPGAIIKSAQIDFTSHAASDVATTLDISGEDNSYSMPFSASTNDIGTRLRTTAREIWSADPWPTVGTTYSSVDVSRIVQEITDRSDWCGGNPMTLFLKGEGLREAVSYEQNSIKAPALRITYAPESVPVGTYCSNSSVVASIADSADDLTEDGTSLAVDLAGNSLATQSGSPQSIGLRFRGVQIPQGATIVSAALELTSDSDITDTADITISVEDSDDSAAFYGTSGELSSRSFLGSSVSWSSQPPVAAGEGSFTDDLRPLVAAIVNRAGWSQGSAMTFRLESASATTLRAFTSFDADPSMATRLIVYFQAEREQPGTRFRDNLKNAVNELVAQGGTPIVSSLYEAALYYSGNAVDYGKRRGAQEWWDRYHRVSHPASYTGGTVNRSFGCTDSNLDAEQCISETISGSPVYTSPIESQCQTNHIVLLSDGAATSNTAAARVQSLTGIGSCVGTGGGNEACGRELANWLHTNDIDSVMPGQQTITTHTIAFNLTDPTFLQDLASEGGGGYYQASSAAELLNAFKNIFINVSKTDTSFVAPTATVNQYNRLKNREDIYFSLFKPESTTRWAGNLKRYALSGNTGAAAEIVDVNGNAAIDPGTGEFYAGARSFWSSVTDGGSVQLGGAAEQLADDGLSHLNRKVFTYTGTTTVLDDASNELLPENTDLLPEWFDLPPAQAADPDYYTNLVNWSRGMDFFDIDGDGDTAEGRAEMGDPMHSQPTLVNYAGGNSVIYVTTNEGYLHAIDHDTGEEYFAFIPKELLKNLRKYFDNEPTRSRPYGLDGGMSVWLQDTNKNGVVDTGEKAYLYIGMRRGGDLYYAIDISSYTDPKYLWSLKGGVNTVDADAATADGDYLELADTWSRPVKTRVLDGTTVRDVLIFGGGYDPNQDPPVSSSSTTTTSTTRSVDGIGRAIFIADAATGEKLWQTSLLDPSFSDMLYSIPSEVRVIDINFDGLADQLYVGDMGGQIWRIDINNDSGLSGSLTTRITGGVIAQLAGDTPEDARRFYYPPDIAVVSQQGQQQLSISIGSGWRAHPLDSVVEDRFYSLRSPYVYGPPVDSKGLIVYPVITETTTGFSDVTSTLEPAASSIARGWYIDLGGSGEKVLSSSVTVDNQVIFTSYLPAQNSGVCSAAVGAGAMYVLDVRDGSPIMDLDESGSADVLTLNDRFRVLSHAGIPPSSSVLFPESGDATIFVGTEAIEDVDIGELRRRTFWQELMEDDS